MKKQQVIFFFFLSIVSCTSKSSHTGESFLTVDNKIINLPEPLPLNGVKLKLEVTGLYHGFCADSLFVFKTYGSRNTFKIYNSRTLAYYGDLLRGGNGPGEYINISSAGQYQSTPEGIKLWVNDNTIKKIRLINITKSLQQKKVVQEKEYTFKGDFNCPFSINDSSFITLFYSWKNLSFSSYKPLSKVKTDKFDFFNQTLTQTDIFYTSGNAALKPDKTKFAYAMMYLNQVLIMTTDGSKKFSVSIGPPQSKSEIDKTSNGGKIESFSMIATDNKHIWLLYQGLKRSELETWISKPPTSKIIVLDWDGKLLHYFNINNSLLSIFMDPTNNILYGIDRDESIMRYDISKYSK